jgi:hypothetical protein
MSAKHREKPGPYLQGVLWVLNTLPTLRKYLGRRVFFLFFVLFYYILVGRGQNLVG